MDSNDKAIEKTELVITALEYAHTHNLDINSKDDVKKILKAIDSIHVSDKEVEEFIKLLQSADTFMEMTAVKKNAEEKKLPN